MQYLNNLKNSELFYSIEPDDIKEMFYCLNSYIKEYNKDEIILSEGEQVDKIGIILSGRARSIKSDITGKTTIITLLKQGSYIGILLAASKDRLSPVYVQALDNTSVLYITVDNVFKRCAKNCARHEILTRNLFDGISQKAMILHDRNDCLIKSSLRDKILTYLIRISKEQKSSEFIIPLDRDSMAQYLNADRSALSRELSKMQKEGLINFSKNFFILNN
ncbi:MAG: Crp/Fnr family transcriptional regulator [Eubacteriaceae bacterium]|nr:Crp/Fnr family transcriptional regulator [Eubacteriaceae bacterium]